MVKKWLKRSINQVSWSVTAGKRHLTEQSWHSEANIAYYSKKTLGKKKS